ncbi:MAG: AraC family transcriptional regulator [Rhizobiaceae bacterium]|nr:AraC family transcriptional regulator [Rhizobiaceae bacterium]
MIPASSMLLHGEVRACWYEDTGVYRILSGSSLMTKCSPHIHETYTVAFLKRGPATISIGGNDLFWMPYTALLINPYEIMSCSHDSWFEYDVCYPPKQFMDEVARRLHSDMPLKFAAPLVSGPVGKKIGDILASLIGGPRGAKSLVSAEQELMQLIIRNAGLLLSRDKARASQGCVGQARDLIEKLLQEEISVSELSKLVNQSRSHFTRRFRRATGLPPSDYIRQIRLARGLSQIQRGAGLADTALVMGFADQAHFTREFKKVYGTTPGKLVRDIARPYG